MTNSNAAAQAADKQRPKEKGPTCEGEARKVQTRTGTTNYPAVNADGKAFSTLRARLALAGFTLQAVEGAAGYLVSRWGLSSELPNILAVYVFANRVGVRNEHP